MMSENREFANRDGDEKMDEKMQVIKRVDRKYLIEVLFEGRDPFFDPEVSIDEIYQKCLEVLTVEALLSAG